MFPSSLLAARCSTTIEGMLCRKTILVPALLSAVLVATILLAGCQRGGKVRLRPVSADERIEQYQIPRNANIPSLSGIVPGDSDIIGSNTKTQAATAPSLTTQSQQQTAQSTTTHIVRKGETLLSIARRYGVSYRELARRNAIANPNSLAVGQKLSISATKAFVTGETRHIVKKGETLYSIAKKHAVSVQGIKRTNRIQNANKINVGQLLIVRSSKQAGSQSLQRQTASSKQAAAKTTPAKQRKLAKAPRRERKDFFRPLKGKVVSRFGEKNSGQRNNGIDIAAKAGSTIKAAENGIVVYSGSALKGFGNLILVRHADGYLTAYGYNSKNLVSKGDRVHRGQTIAKVGSSGDARKAMLHFELRRNSRPVDPLKHFSKS